jgi:hypothetical protein
VFDPASIPGMIEPGEQQMLTDLAGQVAGAGVIVEFGCFFGRSTACLVNGAARWWTPDGGGPAVLAFDSFACADDAGFAPLLWMFAAKAGVEPLVRRAAGRLDFHPVYRHFTGAAETAGLLRTTATELCDAAYGGGPIGLMHIDAPKFYEEFRDVLLRFFPSLAPGGAVVFQDYFYHWSATLVAAAQLLAEAGILRFERSAATSALARVLRTPDAAELEALDAAMAKAPVAELLDRAREAARVMAVDRPEQFLPRLALAKVQYLWEQGDYPAAQQAFAQMIAEAGGRMPAQVFADFQELMHHGFNLRTLYERDH